MTSLAPLSLRKLLPRVFRHLSFQRRLQLLFLLLVMLLTGLSELISFGAVLPFLVVLSEPQKLWNYSAVSLIASSFDITNASDLILPVCILFALAVLLSGSVRLINLWINCRLAAAIGSDFSCEAYRRTLYQTYEAHLLNNTSALIAGVTKQISSTVLAITLILQFFTSSVVVLSLLVGLFFLNPLITIVLFSLFAVIYVFLAVTARRKLRKNSVEIAELATEQIKTLQDGIGSIRDVIMDSSQEVFVDLYRNTDKQQRELIAHNRFLSLFPRYAVESLGIVGIAALGAGLIFRSNGEISVIPLLGGLALGIQKLLPAVQQMYASWTSVKGYSADIQSVLEMLEKSSANIQPVIDPLDLRENVEISNVSYRYQDADNIISSASINIRRGECLAIIGSTGSGKSTLVDLLMGLLVPHSGTIKVDGVDVHDPSNPDLLVNWRASIAHVPQSIFLADASIAENIAFGVPKEKIDLESVKKAAQIAQISSYIEDNVNGYWSCVGERGIRLSGGQRQRIGIARALYKNAKVLVLDEATSALDNQTELKLMNSLSHFNNDITIIMIAHRLSSIKNCHRVIKLERGKIIDEGTPSQLLSDR